MMNGINTRGKVPSGGGSLVLNADALKSLLSTATDPRLDPFTRKAAVNRNLEITDKIMRQETGIRARRFRKRLTRGNKGEKRSLLDRPVRAFGMDRVRNQRLALLNVFEFAATYGLPREEIEYLDRQLPSTKKNLSGCSEKLVLGFEHLNGPDAEALTFVEASMLSTLVGIDDVDAIFEHLASGIVHRHQRLLTVPDKSPWTIKSDIRPGSNNELESSTTTASRQNSEENAAMHDVVSRVVGSVVHTAVEHELQHEAHSNDNAGIGNSGTEAAAKDDGERLTKIRFEKYLAAFECYLRLRAMALSLGEMRGWAQRSNYQQLFGKIRTADVQGGSSGSSFFKQDNDFLETSRDELDADSYSASAGASATIAGAEIDESMYVANSTMRPRSQPTRRPYIEHDSLYSNNNHFPESQSERSRSGGIAAAGAAHGLPPLRLRKRNLPPSKQMHISRKMLERAGFDSTFSRATPRVLHSKSSSAIRADNSDPRVALAATAGDIEQLRMELSIAREGVKQLNQMVDSNIAWVQSNCDVSAAAPNFSERTKQKCKSMAAERIGNVFADFLDNSLLWAFDRWRTASRYEGALLMAKRYSKLKSIELLTHTLYDAVTRQWLKGWTRWLLAVQSMITAERNVAAVQIQRIVRGFNGRRRFNRIQLGKSAVVMQNLFRRQHALKEVQKKKEEKEMKINAAAALVLQKLFNQLKLMREAQAEAQRRREQRATTRIQKIHRGKIGRKSVAELMTRTGPAPSSAVAAANSASTAVSAHQTHSAGYQGTDLEGLSKTLPARISVAAELTAETTLADDAGADVKAAGPAATEQTAAPTAAAASKKQQLETKRKTIVRRPLAQSVVSSAPMRELREKVKQAKAEQKKSPSPSAHRSTTPPPAPIPIAAASAAMLVEGAADASAGEKTKSSEKKPSAASQRRTMQAPRATRMTERKNNRSPSPSATATGITSTAKTSLTRKQTTTRSRQSKASPSAVPDAGGAEEVAAVREESNIISTDVIKEDHEEHQVIEDREAARPDSAPLSESAVEGEERPITPPPKNPADLLQKENSIVNIQKMARGKIARKKTQEPLIKRRQSVQVIQKIARGNLARKDFSQRRATTAGIATETVDSAGDSDAGSVSSHGSRSSQQSRQSQKVVTIQKVARGKLARGKSKRVLEEKKKAKEQLAAATADVDDGSLDAVDGVDAANNSVVSSLAATEKQLEFSQQQHKDSDIVALDEPDDREGGFEPELEELQTDAAGEESNVFTPIQTEEINPVAEVAATTAIEEKVAEDVASPDNSKRSLLGSFCRILSPSRGKQRSRSGSPFSRTGRASASPSEAAVATAATAIDSSADAIGAETESSRPVDGKFHRSESRGKMELRPVLPAAASPAADLVPADSTALEDEQPIPPSPARVGSPLIDAELVRSASRPALFFSNADSVVDADADAASGAGFDEADFQSIDVEDAPYALEGADAEGDVNDADTVTDAVDTTNGDISVVKDGTETENGEADPAAIAREEALKARREKEAAAKERAHQRRREAEERRKEEATKARAAREEREQKQKRDKERQQRRSFSSAPGKSAASSVPVATASSTIDSNNNVPDATAASAEAIAIDTAANEATSAITPKSAAPKSNGRERRGSFSKASTGRLTTSPPPASGSRQSPNPSDATSRGNSRNDNRQARDRSRSPALEDKQYAAKRIQQLARRRVATQEAKQAANLKRQRIARAQKQAGLLIHWAVITLQRNWRGKAGRKRYIKHAMAKQAELAQKQLAGAVKIQSRARGARDRERAAFIRQQRDEEQRQIEWLRSYQKDTGAALVQSSKDEQPVQNALLLDELANAADSDNEKELNSLSASPDSRTSSVAASAAASAAALGAISSATSTAATSADRKVLKQPLKPPIIPRNMPEHEATDTTEAADDADEESVKNVSTHGSLSGLGLIEKAPRPSSSASNASNDDSNIRNNNNDSQASSQLVGAIEDKIKKLEALERSIQEKEQSMVMAAKLSEDRAAAMEKALQQFEERAKKEEADRLAREELMALAAGPISHRSEYSSQPRMPGGTSARGGRRSLPGTARSHHSAPPSARSARGAIPPDAPRMQHGGEDWVQLWDADEGAYYWYCERTQIAQWETPGEEEEYYNYYDDSDQQQQLYLKNVPEEDSGYESGGAMTDYSTDHYDEYSRGDISDAEYAQGGGGVAYGDGAAASSAVGFQEWEEYYDEQAQANYWYNNVTGEASWTRPDTLADASEQASLDGSSQRSLDALALVPVSGAVSTHSLDDASAWVSYIDPVTQQAYWYNVHTGDTSWA